ncbi:MAG: hypothetical protein O3A96_16335 [Proteobacteria bacterium]|nr:hypothetical protein [Pseudomonadota bacterium]
MTEIITATSFEEDLSDESLDRTETGRACYMSARDRARACLFTQ